MSLYTDYLAQIQTRKEQGLHPKPIETAELVAELIGQITDINHEYREGSLDFFIYNILPGTTSAVVFERDPRCALALLLSAVGAARHCSEARELASSQR